MAKLVSKGIFDTIDQQECRRHSLILMDLPKYSGNEIMRIRKKLKLTRYEFGRLLSVTEKTVIEWERGYAYPMASQTKLLYIFDKEPMIMSRYFLKFNECYADYFEDERFDEL